MVSDGVNTISMSTYLNSWVTIGASGACYGVLLAFGMTFPEERIMLLFPPIPMKAKYFVVGYALIEVFSAFYSNGNIAHFAHLGGMFFGWLYFRNWRRKIMAAQNRGHYDPYTRNYSGGSSSAGGGVMQRILRSFQQAGAAIEGAIRSLFSGKAKNNTSSFHTSSTGTNTAAETDQEYNLRRRKEQERIDEILDKVRRSGYASLTEEEKKDLFNNTRRS